MKPYIRNGIIIYILSDYITSVIGWAGFFFFRKLYLENFTLADYKLFIDDRQFLLGMVIIPLGWVLLYHLLGFYTNIYRKSRLNEIAKTFLVTCVGVMILFFAVLIDDAVPNYA